MIEHLYCREDAVQKAEMIFTKLDVDGDGDLSEVGQLPTTHEEKDNAGQDEFVDGCLQDQDLVRALEDSQQLG